MRLQRHFELKRACGPTPAQVWGRSCGLGHFCGRSKIPLSGNHAAISCKAWGAGLQEKANTSLLSGEICQPDSGAWAWGRVFTWSRDVGRHSRGYQEGNLRGREIIILQAAQGGEFTCWEGSAVSEMQSWWSRARAEDCGRVWGLPLFWLEREAYTTLGDWK